MALPTVLATDDFNHGNFTVPGGGPYSHVVGTPTKDTTIVHAPDPASLLISTVTAAEYVNHTVTGTRTMPWHGFWWRMESADEPSGTVELASLTVGAGSDGYLKYNPATNVLFHSIGATGTASISYTLGTWVWVEQIFDVSTGTAGIYTRVAGVDLTPVTNTHTITTATRSQLGSRNADTGTWRFSNSQWGYAAAVNDWLGAPSGLTLDSALPDADVVTTGWSTAPLFSKINDASDATVIQATAV